MSEAHNPTTRLGRFRARMDAYTRQPVEDTIDAMAPRILAKLAHGREQGRGQCHLLSIGIQQVEWWPARAYWMVWPVAGYGVATLWMLARDLGQLEAYQDIVAALRA